MPEHLTIYQELPDPQASEALIKRLEEVIADLRADRVHSILVTVQPHKGQARCSSMLCGDPDHVSYFLECVIDSVDDLLVRHADEAPVEPPKKLDG